MTTHETSVFNPNSPQAEEIQRLFYYDIGISLIILLIVASLVIYAVIHFRHRAGAAEPVQDHGNRKLETLWTIGPALIVVFLAVVTARVMLSVNAPVKMREPDVVINSRQWWWEYHYPKSGVVTANELHMPAGTNWLLRVLAADVIHDFWVPALGAKVDGIPGRTNHIWMKPKQVGTYIGTCAEFCGNQHALMGIRVIVETPQQFEAWQKSQLQAAPEPASEAARRGARLFETRTCINCHDVAPSKGNKVGPDLAHLADRQTLGSGSFDNTMENLEKWIDDPQRMKPGVYMPTLRLSKTEVNEIAVYLAGMKSTNAPQSEGTTAWK